MKTSFTKNFLAVLFFFHAGFAAQDIRFDSLDVSDNVLYVSYKINDLLNEKSVDALQRGIKSEVVHTIQLWRNKSFINPLEKEIPYRIKVYWDNWEKKYRIESDDEKRLTPHLETVRQKCSTIEHLAVANLNELEKNEKYRITIQVDFQLISAESYNAISDIFTGDDGKESPKKKSGFVSMFVNLLGFGDKEFTYKTRDFIITESGEIDYVE